MSMSVLKFITLPVVVSLAQSLPLIHTIKTQIQQAAQHQKKQIIQLKTDRGPE